MIDFNKLLLVFELKDSMYYIKMFGCITGKSDCIHLKILWDRL